MRNGSQARKGATRCASLLFALIIALTSVLPGGLLTASAAAVGLGDLNGDSVTNGVASYEMANTRGNNLAVSDSQENTEFTYSGEITFQQGNNASIMFGADSNDPNKIGNQDGSEGKFFAVEVSREGEASDATIFIKMFEDGPGAMGEGIIDRAVALSNVDTTQPVKFSLTVDSNKDVSISINDTPFSYTPGGKYDQYKEEYDGG